MNFLAWSISIGILVTVAIQSVNFSIASICRQKAWLKGVEMKTRTLLYKPAVHERGIDLSCKLYVTRKDKTVSWQRLPQAKSHTFHLNLPGKI